MGASQDCHFEWPWVTSSDLVRHSHWHKASRGLCDSWASCQNIVFTSLVTDEQVENIMPVVSLNSRRHKMAIISEMVHDRDTVAMNDS